MGPTPPPVQAISELVLEVADLDAARAFYRDGLGLEETLYGEGREGRYWYLIGESARLGLWTPQVGLAGGRGGAHVHFALRIPHGSIDEWQARLEATGKPVTRFDFGDGNRSVYIDDPDGNCVELMDAVVDWSGSPVER